MNHLDDDEGVFQGQFTKREEKIIIFGGCWRREQKGFQPVDFNEKRNAYE